MRQCRQKQSEVVGLCGISMELRMFRRRNWIRDGRMRAVITATIEPFSEIYLNFQSGVRLQTVCVSYCHCNRVLIETISKL